MGEVSRVRVRNGRRCSLRIGFKLRLRRRAIDNRPYRVRLFVRLRLKAVFDPSDLTACGQATVSPAGSVGASASQRCPPDTRAPIRGGYGRFFACGCGWGFVI